MTQTGWELDAMWSAELDRQASCHYGDHDYDGAARCSNCGHFDGALLAWAAQEKADREGRHHGDHWHRTMSRAESCPRKTHPEGPCADTGGCLHHEASENFVPDPDGDPNR